MLTSATSLSNCCFRLPQAPPGHPGPPGPPGPSGTAAFDSFRCLCIAQLQNFLAAVVECVPNADEREYVFNFVAGPTNFVTAFIRADIDYRNRILIPVFNDPPTGQPPDRFINLFNIAVIFPSNIGFTEEQISCIYNNMRTNNPAAQFQLGGCEAQTNRQLVNTLRALQGEEFIIFAASIGAPGEIELVLPGIVVLENVGFLFAIRLCDIESIAPFEI